MRTAKSGDRVQVNYTGTLTDGSVFDSSEGRAPLAFVLGEQMVIPGFEKAVEGLAVGESVTVAIPPAEAYGERSDELILTVNRSEMPADLNPQPGMMLQVGLADGSALPMTVADTSLDTVTLDGNHQLAGETLTFEIELVDIAEA